jgi:hypothetical protein
MIDFSMLQWGLLTIGIILLLISVLRFGVYMSGGVRMIIGIIGIILLVVAFAGPSMNTSTPPTQTIAPVNTANVIDMKSVAGVSSISGNTVIVKAAINVSTSTPVFNTPANGLVKFDFSLYRTSLNSGAASFTVTLGTDAFISNNTNTANNAYLVTQYSSNGTVQTTLQTPTATVMGQNAVIIMANAGDIAQVNVTMQLNAQAVANLIHTPGSDGISGVGALEDYTLSVAGHTITVEVELTSIVN